MMKLLTFIFLVIFPIFTNAQDVKMRALGPMQMIVSYEMEQLGDYPNRRNAKGWRVKSTMMLEIGDKTAHSYVVEEHKNLISQFVTFRNKNRWKVEMFNTHALLGETFLGYPKTKELTQIVNLDAAGVYKYTEAIPKLKWTISSKTKTIMGYNCQCATTKFCGREYEAWFTSDIPLSFGPWKFQGLPGLILEVKDTKDEYSFTANGIEQVKEKKYIMMYDEEIRNISRSRALKMEAMLHKDHGAYAADYGITFRLDGMEHEPLPYHPIELK